MSEWAFVALGSNLGNREKRLRAGRNGLKNLSGASVLAETAVEETAPIGPNGQKPYLNQMVVIQTDLAPEALLNACHEIERGAGRTRRSGARWGPRTLDLDIVRFGDRHSSSPQLTLPHPELANRPFWQRELAQLIPNTWQADGIGLPAWAHVRDGRRRHIERVTALMEVWAVARRMPSTELRRWVRAGFLHDALKDAPKPLLADLAGCRWGIPSLYHGPAAARMASQHGESDQGVLDAVTYHSIGFAGWDNVGKMIYLADYLEPGRSSQRSRRAAWSARVPRDPSRVLWEVARDRMGWMVSKGMPLLREGVDFWNSLVTG